MLIVIPENTNICITSVQRRPNVFDIVQFLCHMDGIMHKWANPQVQYETNKYKLTQKGNKISVHMV